jgi:hypothetical protein
MIIIPYNENMLDPYQANLYDIWSKVDNVPQSDDYDMEGYFNDVILKGKDQSSINPSDNRMHYPDTYKLPNHPTFSAQSKYYKKSMPYRDWIGNLLVDFNSGKIVSDENDVMNMFKLDR